MHLRLLSLVSRFPLSPDKGSNVTSTDLHPGCRVYATHRPLATFLAGPQP
jgi:hypothetical protein